MGELVAGLFLLALALLFGGGAIAMERPGGWATAPGLVPLVASVALGLLSLAICVRAAVAVTRAPVATGSRGNVFRGWRIAAGVAITAAFYFVLLRIMPFEPAATLFLLAITGLFRDRALLRRRVAVSALSPLVVAALLGSMFGVPLPGTGSLVESAFYLLARG